ncbi:hypothetical protein M9Y10_023213 [Tritrichomonas musculus]|uniref:Uncharacterized protein n=1 Tax=Tritrichomonas musculus TaxID=1915356 RepID=A0ABR2KUS5_9EUKA
MSHNEILKNETSPPNETNTTDDIVPTNHNVNDEKENSKDTNDSSPFDFDDFTNNSEDFINYSNIRSESNKNSMIQIKDNKNPVINEKAESTKSDFELSNNVFTISSISSNSEDKLLLLKTQTLSDQNKNIFSENSTSSMIDFGSISVTSAASSIKSISTSSPKNSTNRILNNIQKAKSPGNLKSDAIRRAISKKNSLQAQFNAISVQRKQLSERENDLQDKIDILNERSGETMRILDSKKDILISENDELRMQYERYPTVEYLSKQLAIITEILETLDDNDIDNNIDYEDVEDNSDSDTSSEIKVKNDAKKVKSNQQRNYNRKKKRRVLDENTMRKIGVLQKSNEDLSILPERLNYLVNRLDTMKSALIALTPSSAPTLISNNSDDNIDPEQQKKMLQEEKEKRELMRKIKLLKISMKASFNRTQFQCENLKTDIQRLINECETIKTVNNNLPKLHRNRSQNNSRINTPNKSSPNSSSDTSNDKSESTEEFFFKIKDSELRSTSNSTPNTSIKEETNSIVTLTPTREKSDNSDNSISKPKSNDSLNSNVNNESDSADFTQEDLDKYKEGYALSALSYLDIFDKDVKHMLKNAGGDISNLHFNGNNEYEYNGFRFKVSKKEKKLYAFSDGDTVLLPIFLSNIVYL